MRASFDHRIRKSPMLKTTAPGTGGAGKNASGSVYRQFGLGLTHGTLDFQPAAVILEQEGACAKVLEISDCRTSYLLYAQRSGLSHPSRIHP